MTGTHVPLLRSDLYEIAYLAGGPRRVVETAVVALVENGRLRVDRATGRLHVVDPHRRHPVEAVVLDAVGPRGRSVWGLVWRARSDPRLATVADGLARDGLLTRRGGVDARERSFWTLSGLTRAGRAALRQVRQSPPSPPVTGGDPALAVALAGPSAWGAELHTAVFDPPPPYLPTPPGQSVREVRRSRSGVYPHGGSAGWAGGGWGGGFGGDCGGGGGGGGDGGC
jgi:uncharacterized membrane protein YgcG